MDLTSHQQDYVLMGDFNINAMDTNHPSTKRFVDLLRSFDLELFVKTPTRVTHSTQSTIDNIISNLSSVAVSVVNTAISDHYGQEAIISGVKIERELKITKTIRDLRPGNIALLNTSLSKEDWKFQESSLSVEQHFKMFSDTLNFHVNMYCPLKTIQVCPKTVNNKWITKGILISREKLKFFSEIQKTSHNEEFKRFFRN
uniref:Endonuclease/exonuclease/phosphatase domain-containing protein n=1 Tax=Homalodisca liturata TaxID=320908 RepID=A0A1B6JA74_9HEMI